MSNVVYLKDYRNKRVKPKVSYTPFLQDYDERIEPIRKSLEKINKLMAELRQFGTRERL